MSAKTRSTSAKWLGPGLGLGLGLGLGGKRGRDGAPLQRAGGWTPACLYLDIFSPWRPAHGRGVCLYRRRSGIPRVRVDGADRRGMPSLLRLAAAAAQRAPSREGGIGLAAARSAADATQPRVARRQRAYNADVGYERGRERRCSTRKRSAECTFDLSQAGARVAAHELRESRERLPPEARRLRASA